MQEQCRLISLAEYQKLLSDSMAKDEGVEINAELVQKMHIMEKKLAIATKALELYQNEEPPKNCPKEDEKGSYYPFRYNYVVAKEALKQIEELSK